jgi:hypothetical protein
MAEEFEDNDIQPDPAQNTSRQSRWLKVGLGLAGVILILVLAWPNLRGRSWSKPPLPIPRTACCHMS